MISGLFFTFLCSFPVGSNACSFDDSISVCQSDKQSLKVPLCAFGKYNFSSAFFGNDSDCKGSINGDYIEFTNSENSGNSGNSGKCEFEKRKNGTHFIFETGIKATNPGRSYAGLINRHRHIRLKYFCALEVIRHLSDSDMTS